MATVTISKAAQKDIVHIREYIRVELANPDAARRIIRELRESIQALSEMPERGKPLDAILAVHTDFRFLVCENYRVFYLCDSQNVEVVRVLHTLQDYMRALFLS